MTEKPPPPPELNTFPDEFRLGVAEADLQVVGEDAARAAEGSEETSWNRYSKERLLHPIGDAIKRFSSWREDVAWFKELGVKHYRTSISVARILRENGEPNQKAIQWYRDYFSALREAGVSIYATLYHWELPQYFQDKGGWTNDSVVDLLSRHAAVVHDELGDLIEEYFAVNEPWCITVLGHFFGVHAPGQKDLRIALKVGHNVLRSVAAIERTLHKKNPRTKVSHVGIIFPIYALSESDREAAQRAWEFYNDWYIKPLFEGRYPAALLKAYGDHMPAIDAKEMRELVIGEKLHALGVNFYNGEFVRNADRAPINFECVTPAGTPTNDLGWPIALPPQYPHALKDALSELYHTYKHAGLSRLYVTENGMAQRSDPTDTAEPFRDYRRIHYLREHLRQVLSARSARIPVDAYFLWTLMDNFEWQSHYLPEAAFGLIQVRREDLKRVPKQSFHWYQNLIKTRMLEDAHEPSK